MRREPTIGDTLPDLEENASPFGFAMNDVTSRIAHAYAKHQVFVWSGLLLLGSSLLSLTLGGESFPDRIDRVVVAVGGLVLVVHPLRERDLKKLNRTAVLLVGALLVITGVASLLAFLGRWDLGGSFARGEDATFLGLQFALVLGYPFPSRKGSTVLFTPEKVRALSNSRTFGFGSVFLGLAGAILLVGPSAGRSSPPFPPDLAPMALVAVGVVGFLLYLATKDPAKVIMPGAILSVVGVGLSAVAAWDAVGTSAVLAPALTVALGSVLLLVLVFALSLRINRGKVIVDRRA